MSKPEDGPQPNRDESRKMYDDFKSLVGQTIDGLVRQLGEESPADRLIGENINNVKSLQLLIRLGKITAGEVHSYCINQGIENPLEDNTSK